MAAVVIKPIELKELNEFVKETNDTDFVAVDATDGAVFTMRHRDEKYVIGVKNINSTSGNKTVTIKAGDHIQSAFGDLAFTLAKDEIAWVAIDSGRFKNISGDLKGKVHIVGTDANVAVKVIRLP